MDFGGICSKTSYAGEVKRTGIRFLFFYFMVLLESTAMGVDVYSADLTTAPRTIKTPDSLGWNADVNAGLNLSQTAYSNWTKGGESALVWLISNSSRFLFNGEKFLAAIDGAILYGKTKIGGSEARKSDDRLDIECMIQNKKPIISLFASVRAETQFGVGKQYTGEGALPVSDFVDPLYLHQTAGALYSYRQNFQARIGVALKQTITRRYPFWSDNKATERIEKLRSEQGLSSLIKTNIKFMKNLNYKAESKVFSTLKSLRNTDVQFENILVASINKYMNVNFHYYVVYDRNASERAQMSEGLALGLTFNIW